MVSTFLAIAPHPDDVELGMGGTIAGLIAEGNRVVVVDLSDGEPTPEGSAEIRAKETLAASSVLGIVERKNLGITCREIFDTVENRKRLATVIREVKPSVIFAPYWEDGHPDHVQASALADAARFYAKFVKTDMPFEAHTVQRSWYYFSLHLRIPLKPTICVDISSTVAAKKKALEAYHSQFSGNPRNRGFIERVLSENRYWGTQTYCEAAEPFASREVPKISLQGL